MKRAIAVFAHNESKKIISCLESVAKAIQAGDECYVLNNGSTDNTGLLVDQFSKKNPFVKHIGISIGDKANAWNVFSHDLNISARLFVFLDGDCTIAPESIDALESCLEENPRANAAAGLPDERVSRKNREEMVRNGGLAGNLYALSPDFMQRIRIHHVRLPLGLIGDDSLVGALAYWDLDPSTHWDKSRIVNCEGATFSYKRLSLFSTSDMLLHWRRKIRYSLRNFQNILIREPLKVKGLKAMPYHIEDLYPRARTQLGLRWNGLDTLFDLLALKIIHEAGSRREATSH